MQIEDLSKDELLNLLKDFSKRWLAHDGLWFLQLERRDGMKRAIEIDREVWRRFTLIEAKRIMGLLGLEEGGGLDSLERALNFRLYALVNIQEAERRENRLIFTMKECRVQKARERKGLDLFPCKEVGRVEYEGFATAIDPRIETKCLQCPPDDLRGDYYCRWEFLLKEE